MFTNIASSSANTKGDGNDVGTFISTYKLLNVFVTNCALENIKSQLLSNNMPVICKWFDDFVQDVAAVDTVNSIVSSRAPPRSMHLLFLLHVLMYSLLTNLRYS